MQEQFLQIESAHREGRTRQYGYRLKQLRGLHRMLLEKEPEFLDALNTGIPMEMSPELPHEVDEGPDKKQDAKSTQLSFHIILNVVATEATRLHELYKKLQKQALSTVSTSSVLILGDKRGRSTPLDDFRRLPVTRRGNISF